LPAAQSASSPPDSEHEHGAPRILVVEDSPMNQRVALGMLEQLGYAVAAVGNGLEALDAVQRTPFAAILMDCQMPQMDGFAASVEIRRREVAGQHVPIIAMTANAMKGDRERCLAAGMDDYLSKPVRFEDLQVALGRAVPQHALQDRDQTTERDEALDPDALQRLRRSQRPDQPDIIASLLGEFRTSAQPQLAMLQGAVAEADAAALASVAHRLKGEAAIMGALVVSALCAELEALGRAPGQGWLAEATALVARLESELDRAVAALERHCPVH
jgi:hypothetical protein